MASAAEDEAGSTLVGSAVLRMGDEAEDGRLEIEKDMTGTLLWGEFQGTQQNEGEEEGNWRTRGLRGCRPDENWTAFTGEEIEETDSQETHKTQCDGRWWCESSTKLCMREHPQNKNSIGHIFAHCFPQVSHPHIEEDIKPLETLLHDPGPEEHRQAPTRNACHHRSPNCLWGTRSNIAQDPDALYKWERSQIRSAYLSSLQIKPTDKIPPHRTRFSASSPAPKQRIQPHKMSTGLARDPELKLMKMASVTVHVTGFSPSHHLQSLFQHWSQPSGKTRLKVAYDFNRSLLV
ncbi:uncharacterized protein PAF06_020235 [Gastrophryne carolinensis]